MISGVGIDMIDVERIEQRIKKENGFKELIFSKKEIAYCESKANKFEHYAARFAAKEAFFKALGTGWADGINFNETEIANNAAGKPELVFTGTTKKILSALEMIKISVSLSHLKTLAAAVVIIEKES
jgi:holo-[acyl-carrier protein] synthase